MSGNDLQLDTSNSDEDLPQSCGQTAIDIELSPQKFNSYRRLLTSTPTAGPRNLDRNPFIQQVTNSMPHRIISELSGYAKQTPNSLLRTSVCNAAPENSSNSSLLRKQTHSPLVISTNNLVVEKPPYPLVERVDPTEFINFKKPQSVLFNKLDGKIQQIVAAHSNLNKLYALNEFSPGQGSKKPLELPPQLPPPPPCIPKPSSDHMGMQASSEQKVQSYLSKTKLEMSNTSPLFLNDKSSKKPKVDRDRIESASCSSFNPIKLPDEQKSAWTNSINENSINIVPSSSPQTRHPPTTIKMSELAKLIKETFDASNRKADLSGNDIEENLMKTIRQQIVAAIAQVDKNSTIFKTNSQRAQANLPSLKSQLKRLSNIGQSSISHARNETSLLLNKHARSNVSSGSSLLASKQANNKNLVNQNSIPYKIESHTMKVIVPPSEQVNPAIVDQALIKKLRLKRPRTTHRRIDYNVLKSKIASFKNAYAKVARKGYHSVPTFLNHTEKKPAKKLDFIVERLANKVVPVIEDEADNHQSDDSIQLKDMNTSADVIQPPQLNTQITPIPVFSSPSQSCNKNLYIYTHSGGNVAKTGSMKSKLNKKGPSHSLRISNYTEKELPQPTIDKITVEQFARYLNLVHTDDVMLQKKRQQLMESEMNWKSPIGSRPLRFRRINRGERFNPSGYRSANYVGSNY